MVVGTRDVSRALEQLHTTWVRHTSTYRMERIPSGSGAGQLKYDKEWKGWVERCITRGAPSHVIQYIDRPDVYEGPKLPLFLLG